MNVLRSDEMLKEVVKPYIDIVKQVQDEHPEYAEQIALTRRAAELQALSDKLAIQQVHEPVMLYETPY